MLTRSSVVVDGEFFFFLKIKDKRLKIKDDKPFGLQSFDVAVDFPFGDLCSVKVPFSAFLC